MATARPITNPSSNIPGLRARALQSVFPGMPTPAGTPANGPMPIAPADRTRAQGTLQQSAASRAAAAVAAHLAANPVKPVAAPVKSTRANSQLTQSAGTINTGYVNSAAAQGYNNVTPPNIYSGATQGRAAYNPGLLPSGLPNPFAGQFGLAGHAPTHNREFFRNQVFTPPPSQAIFASPERQAELYNNPIPPASAILRSPLSNQVGVPVAQFPPRGQFLNYLFPR